MQIDADKAWHLDKKVPVAIIAVLLMQVAGLVWWGSQIESRVSVAERDITRVERQQETARRAAQLQAVQLGRIEENLSAMRTDIQRLIETLDRRTGQ